MNKQVMMIGGIIVAVLIGILIFSNRPSSPVEEIVEKTDDGSMMESDKEMTNIKQEYTITGSNFKYDLDSMTVKKGDTVKITFTSEGGSHNFVIDEFGVKTKVLSGGEKEVVTFVADKAGTYKYYCSVGNHRAMGMEGTLIVQ